MIKYDWLLNICTLKSNLTQKLVTEILPLNTPTFALHFQRILILFCRINNNLYSFFY